MTTNNKNIIIYVLVSIIILLIIAVLIGSKAITNILPSPHNVELHSRESYRYMKPEEAKINLLEFDQTKSVQTIKFRIERKGRPLTDLQMDHERLVHLILIKSDMSDFFHLHPILTEDGIFTVELQFRPIGSWIFYAQGVSKEHGAFIAQKSFTDGTPGNPSLTENNITNGIQSDYNFDNAKAQTGILNYSVDLYKNSFEIEPENYLGARGHSVVVNVLTKQMLHVHPETNNLAFTAQLPEPGVYKIFTEFQVGGKVYKTEKIVRSEFKD